MRHRGLTIAARALACAAWTARAASLACVTGCGDAAVVRVVDGRAERGRFVSEAAYALYARGTLAEASGDDASALRAFRWAADEDPESAEIWVRIGAIHCRPGNAAPAAASAAFERARTIDAGYGPLHRERARCRSSLGDVSGALADAEQALALDPDDLETGLVHADALERAGRAVEARRALRALGLRRTGAAQPWRSLLNLAQRAGDPGLTREAEEHLRDLRTGLRAAASAGGGAIDEALRRGDLAEADRLARARRIASSEVAVRAAALGLPALARDQATLVLAADRGDATARIALVAAADLAGDEAALASALRDIPRSTAGPSPLARWLLADVLQRRIGAGSALAWLGPVARVALDEPAAANPRGDGADPVLAALERRVRAALAAP
jgi:hypothetical protein